MCAYLKLGWHHHYVKLYKYEEHAFGFIIRVDCQCAQCKPACSSFDFTDIQCLDNTDKTISPKQLLRYVMMLNNEQRATLMNKYAMGPQASGGDVVMANMNYASEPFGAFLELWWAPDAQKMTAIQVSRFKRYKITDEPVYSC